MARDDYSLVVLALAALIGVMVLFTVVRTLQGARRRPAGQVYPPQLLLGAVGLAVLLALLTVAVVLLYPG